MSPSVKFLPRILIVACLAPWAAHSILQQQQAGVIRQEVDAQAEIKTQVLLQTAQRKSKQPPRSPRAVWPQGQVGDSFGRPLYALNTVNLPDAGTTGRHCIAVRMDRGTHALVVDQSTPDVNTVAWGCYEERLNTTGWSQLEVSTSEDADVPLQVRAYGAGLVEGFLTAPRIVEFHSNVMALLVRDTNDTAQLNAVDRVIRTGLVAWEKFSGGDTGTEPQDDLPRQAWAALLQLRGIRDASNIHPHNPTDLTAHMLMVLNMHAEIPAIVDLYSRSEQMRMLQSFLTSQDSSARSWARWAAHTAKGSAIVRRLGSRMNPEDLLAGHVTFGEYGEMSRMMKHYDLHFSTLVSGISMSSYPGCISSTDDFIQTSRGVVAMSTSLWLPPAGIYSMPAPTEEGLPAFLRAMIATRLATQPRMWAKIYGYVPGIAGAKQWLILDYSKFRENQVLPRDTLWMVESLPRIQRAGDVTEALFDSGFFEAHGVAHFRQIREIFGLPPQGEGPLGESHASSLVEQGATMNSVANMREMLGMSLANRPGQIPISGRNDLNSTHPVPSGGIDAKVTNKCTIAARSFLGRSGPPRSADGGNFSWMDSDGRPMFPSWPHQGLPTNWNFSWVNTAAGQELVSPVVASMSQCEPAPANQ